LTDQDLINVLDELATLSRRIRIDIRWRPVSADPDDDMVIECAVNGQADLIIAFNTRDLRVAYDRFGILVLTAQVRRILGFETRFQVYEFLAAHGVPWVDYDEEELRRELETLRELTP
jgi:hypothetical protein